MQVVLCARQTGFNKASLISVVTAFANCMTTKDVTAQQFLSVMKDLELFPGRDEVLLLEFFSHFVIPDGEEGAGQAPTEELTTGIGLLTKESRSMKLAVRHTFTPVGEVG